MSQVYLTSNMTDQDVNQMNAFDQQWNSYPNLDEEWSSHYSCTDIKDPTLLPLYNVNGNLSEFVLDNLDSLLPINDADMNMMSPDSQMPPVTSSQQSPLDFAEQMLASPSQITSSTLPTCNSFPGDYNFQVTLEKQPKKTKSANYIFSRPTNKLFVKINKPCPFLFKTANTPPNGSVIRALPVFQSADYIHEVVQRCPTHKAKNQHESSMLAQHLLLSEHQMARHVEDSYTGRFSAIIPYEAPQAGAEWVTNLYKFMCFSSCHSGYNRRPLTVIFTLECDSIVLGRQVVKVRCCASPGRDEDQEERNLTSGKNLNKKRSAPSFDDDDAAGMMNSFVPDVKRQRRGKDDDVFMIQVRGREHFELLRLLRDSLEIAKLLPPDVIAKFREQQTEFDSMALKGELIGKPQQQQRPTDTIVRSSLLPTPAPVPTPSAAPGKIQKKMMINSFDCSSLIASSFSSTQLHSSSNQHHNHHHHHQQQQQLYYN